VQTSIKKFRKQIYLLENKKLELNFMKIDSQEYVTLPLMTVAETARYMGVGRKVVYQLIEFGQIRAVKNKRSVVIEKASVDAFRTSGKLT
jgi:excisionase family DNA binding protein